MPIARSRATGPRPLRLKKVAGQRALPAWRGSTISAAPSLPPGSGSSSGTGSAFTDIAASLCSPAMSSRIFAPGLLDGQVCVVSGAGTGLGKATAFELSGLGATVIGCGRRTEPLQGMADEVAARGGKAEFEALDIRDDEAVGGFMAGIVERHGALGPL